MFEQEFAPLPGVFTRLVCLSDKRQTLQRELCGVGETDAPAAYPSPMRQLCLVKVADRFLEAIPGGRVRQSDTTDICVGLTRYRRLGTRGGTS